MTVVPDTPFTPRRPPAEVGAERRGGLKLTLDFWRDPFGSLDELQRSQAVVFSNFMGWQMALVSTPELAWEVLGGSVDLWHKDRLMKRSGAVFGDGLLLSDGETWKRQRRMLQPGFRHARYAAYAEIMREEAQAALAGWTEGRHLDLSAEMARVTLRIAVRTLFGSDLDDAGVAAVGRAFTRVSDFLAGALASSPVPLPRWLPLPELRRYYAAVDELDAVVARVVEARRARGSDGGVDLLGMLLEARDDDGSGLDDTEIRDQVMTFLLAGHETTALLLTHALLLLAHEPEERARLEAEVDALSGPVGLREPLPRTRAVVAETLRLRPPAWVLTREASRDTELGGHPVAKGTIVCVAPWQLHRDPRYWGPDAETFRPDRFAEGAPAPARGTYLPFGLGGRSCIGLRFAELEARLLLATWAREVRFEPDSDELPELLPSITARPAHPVGARVRRRSTSG